MKKIIFAKNIIIMKQEFTKSFPLQNGLNVILNRMYCCC
jgi:hypothetical protein